MQKQKIRGMVLAAVVCCVSLSGCGAAEKTAQQTDLPDIIIGSDNYPPYNYENVDGKPTGIDVDLATEAFRRMGYQAVFTYIDWEKKKELVDSGKIDCIWGSFSIDGREEEYRWSAPYMMSRQVVAVNRDSEIKTLADLEGKRIAVQSTTKPEALFLSHTDARLPVLREVFSMQNRELIYPCLSKGYADAIAAHETAILQCMSDYKLDYRILEEPLRLKGGLSKEERVLKVKTMLETVGLGVAFSKQDDRGLEQKLSETFEEMRADGTMEEIIGRYLEENDMGVIADVE